MRGTKQQSKDFRWVVKNMEDLYRNYGHSYLIIKDESVAGAYDDYYEAVDAAKQKYPMGSFLVQECGADESAYTIQIASMNFDYSEAV